MNVAVIFPKWSNYLPLALGVGAVVVPVVLISFIWYYFSPKYTDVGYQPHQPIPFSHYLHAGQLGLDCRYCHSTVEKAAFAAVPPSQTCNGCHQVIKSDSAALAPLRESMENDTPIKWVNVHMLPDYVKFNHSAHVAQGVGCVSCHGQIDQMKVVAQNQPLSMGWCLDCHRNPEPSLRPLNEVTNMSWDHKKAGYDPHQDPMRTRKVQPPTDCSSCHM